MHGLNFSRTANGLFPGTQGTALVSRFCSFFCAIAVASVAVVSSTRADLNPAPDGGYPNANTAEGNYALSNLGTGFSNTGVGRSALYSVGSGNENTAVGDQALLNNTNNNNTALGARALYSNTSGAFNTATGSNALQSNIEAGVNVANGYSALQANTHGFYNVACGGFALGTNIGGSYNVATGANALYYNKGNNNTATGHQALQNNTTGSNNIAIGYQAGNNISSGSNNIAIGALGGSGESNTIRIGKYGTHKAAYIQGVYGATVASTSGVPVYVDSNGHLGTIKSSARFKDEIRPMDKASEALLKLQPVTFRYKTELDPDGVRQFGLIAEQVEKMDPDLVVRDADGKVSTVRYDAVNAMLLNEFLKEHRKVEALEATIAKQQKQIETLATTVERVNAQMEMAKPAPRFSANQR